VRDRTNDVTAHAQSFLEELCTTRVREDPLLREGNQLEIDEIAHLLAYLEQGTQADEVRVAHIDMAADDECSLAGVPLDRPLGTVFHRVDRELRLRLCPALDPFEEGTGLVVASQPLGQRSIEVAVRLDQWRRDESSGRIDRFQRLAFDPWLDRGDPPVSDRQIDQASIAETAIADDEVIRHQRYSFLLKRRMARGIRPPGIRPQTSSSRDRETARRSVVNR